MAKEAGGANVRVPAALAARVEEVCGLTDAICAQHLNAEYALLCRQLVAKLGRRRPSPLTKGEARTWAAGVLHAVGTVNFLFDREQRPHLTPDELSRHTGVAKSTTAAKSRLIQDLLGIGPFEPEFCRRELLAQNPLAWMVSVDGLIVDARMLPPEVQEELRRRGVIPDLPTEEP